MSAPSFLLGLDTSGSSGSVALARMRDQRSATDSIPSHALEVLAEDELAGHSYSAQLIATVAHLLERASITLADVAAIVVTHGPGSFTGIRVGLSTAKGLVHAAGMPLIAVSSLAVLASVSGFDSVLAVMDAGRNEYYAGEYRGGKCAGERLLTRDGLVAAAAGLAIAVAEPALYERLAALEQSLDLHRVSSPTAADVLRVALPRYRAAMFDDLDTLDANYLRRSDAELFARAAAPAATSVR